MTQQPNLFGTKQKVPAQIWTARAMRAVANVYKSTNHAIYQALENSRDAGAKNVWVIVYKTKLVIIDDGLGIVPGFLDDDGRKLTKLFKLAGEGDVSGVDLKKLIAKDSPSRRSFEWMTKCVALSSKDEEDEDTKGNRGIGSLAYLYYADRAVISSRPHIDLARAYWGDPNLDEAHNLTYAMDMPSNTALRQEDASYSTPYIVDDPLMDPFGNVMAHGTMIEILDFETPGSIRTPNLQGFLRDQFAGDLEDEDFKIFVIDRVTKQGESSKYGRILPVEPERPTGDIFIDETLTLGTKQFRVQLFFDETAKGKTPSVRYKGVNKFPITDLKKFRDDVWGCGKLMGYIGFPVLQHESRIWDSGKDVLKDSSPEKARWETLVYNTYTERIRQMIQNSNDRTASKAYKKLASEVASAAQKAMAAEDAFKEFSIGFDPGRPRGPRNPKVPRLKDKVIATVLNEHNRGVRNVKIVLTTKNGRRVADGPTGGGGGINFGKLGNGAYRMYIVAPLGVAVRGVPDFNFIINDLDEKAQGFEAVFNVVTGEPKPETHPNSKAMKIVPVPMVDASRPYVQWLQSSGIININRSHWAMKAAEQKGDVETQRSLLAQYVAAAITEHCIEGDPATVTLQVCRLFSRMLGILRDVNVESLRPKNDI